MHFIKYLLLGFVAQFIISDSYGQKTKTVQDFRIIQEISVIKNFSRKWEVSLGPRLILQHDVTQIGEFDIDAGVNYQVFKYATIGAGYRWSENLNKSDEYIVKHRLRGELDLFAIIIRLKAEYRICYQNIDDDLFLSNDTIISRNVLRNRIQLKYNIRKCPITPFLYVEHFGQINRKDHYGIKFKSSIGLDYSINKRHDLKLYYRVDRELNDKDPYTYYYLGLCYEYNF
jgi:hypothetical protein